MTEQVEFSVIDKAIDKLLKLQSDAGDAERIYWRNHFAMNAPRDVMDQMMPETVGDIRDELIKYGFIPESAKQKDAFNSYQEADVILLECTKRFEYADLMLKAGGYDR